ncbi:MAG: Uma2 family endonuclease [Planctomycetes bacterium]|nr:Uma2 family endonuclease [Planctomycetota bacterium]
MIAVVPRLTPSTELPPLANGDHLDQKTFHERYEAMPPDVFAELIGGVVYMSSPQKKRHGRFHLKLSRWVDEYEVATPGVEGVVNSTQILGDASEPQPDASLLILPECGGQVWEDDKGYLHGAPEWIGEISDSTESIDLNRKKLDYEIAGVREYMVVAARIQKVFWFIRRRGKFKEMAPDAGGVFRSDVLPGLWLDAAAFLKGNNKRLLATLGKGLASPEHAAFVAKLAAKT